MEFPDAPGQDPPETLSPASPPPPWEAPPLDETPSFPEPAATTDAETQDDEAPSPLPTPLERLEAVLNEGVAEILQEFRDKLAYDSFKETQIAKLHDELQAHRNNLIFRAERQILQGLIRLHDNLGKVTTSLRLRPVEELTPERFFQQLEGIQDDVELLLGQNGVEPYETGEQEFNPHRQTALRTVATEDPDLVGRIAERLRPGFQQGDMLIQKERVAVYTAATAKG